MPKQTKNIDWFGCTVLMIDVDKSSNLCIACDRKDFCEAWCGKGRSKEPHNFFKQAADGDHMKDKISELGHCFDAIKK